MKLTEIKTYQEEPGGSFTHAGKEYLLNPLFKITKDYPVINFPIKDLIWVLAYYEDDGRCVDSVDETIPILVGQYEDKFAVLDGIHRLIKSINLGKTTIPAKFVDNKILDYCLRDK